MKKFITGIVLLTIAITLVRCTKQPEAGFVTNANEYIAGDVVHLTNTSVNGYIYLWALPDGQKVTSTNVDYPIPANQGFDKLTFILTAYSKGASTSSSISKTVDVIPSSMFAVDSTTYVYYPLNVSSGPYGNNWQINAHVYDAGLYDPNPANARVDLHIELPGTTAPTSAGTYLLQPNDILTSGHAYVFIKRRWWELAEENFVSLSGQLNVTITNEKVHVVFQHITTNNATYKISGDITCL